MFKFYCGVLNFMNRNTGVYYLVKHYMRFQTEFVNLIFILLQCTHLLIIRTEQRNQLCLTKMFMLLKKIYLPVQERYTNTSPSFIICAIIKICIRAVHWSVTIYDYPRSKSTIFWT